jgi:ribonuclease D
MTRQNTNLDLPPPILVTETSQLIALATTLARQPVIAVDTESNSLYAYQEQVCLIQFSLPGTDYLVDPLADLDLSPLAGIFASPSVEKVFHAAEYDVMCLRRDFGWDFANLFDTMWAARVLGWPRIGLGDILDERFGVKLNKRWQRHDWGKRPLSEEALTYARLDTHFLISLREEQCAELIELGRLEEAQEQFEQVAQSEPNFHSFDPDEDVWRVKGVWDLEPRERAVLRELLIWRDGVARRRDRPPFKVLNDRTLTALAQARPRDPGALEQIKGLRRYHVRRYGRKILAAIFQGEKAAPPKPPPPPPRPPDAVLQRYDALRRWRKKRAAGRGVDPDVIVSNATLWTLAQEAPETLGQMARMNVLGPWHQQAYGEALLKVLRRHR